MSGSLLARLVLLVVLCGAARPAAAQPNGAAADPGPVLRQLVTALQDCGPASAFEVLSASMAERIARWSGGTWCIPELQALGPVTALGITSLRFQGEDPIYTLRLLHGARVSLWAMRLGAASGRVEALEFRIETPAPPDRTQRHAPVAGVAPGDACARYPALCDAEAREAERQEAMRQRQRETLMQREAAARRQPQADDDRPGRGAPRTVLPDFPWPPPTPSARMPLPRAAVADAAAQPTLGDVGRQLAEALRQAGYAEHSFYRTPGGFALVARLERIAEDGTPLPEGVRFLAPDARQPFSLTRTLRELFLAPEGFYRFIVLVVNDEAFTATGQRLDARAAQRLLDRGATGLDRAIGALPFTPAHELWALIYEFHNRPPEDALLLQPGRIGASQHLARARLTALLPAAR